MAAEAGADAVGLNFYPKSPRFVTPSQAVLVGYPKLDRLASGGYDRGATRRSLELPDDRPVALYAPTYSDASPSPNVTQISRPAVSAAPTRHNDRGPGG